MTEVLVTIIVVAVVGFPFLMVMRWMARTKRNKGGLHGGGIRKYRRLRNGHFDQR